MTNEEIYHQGFIAGLVCFAWWKDGVEYVGQTQTKLSDAIAVAKTQWSYQPPEEGGEIDLSEQESSHSTDSFAV